MCRNGAEASNPLGLVALAQRSCVVARSVKGSKRSTSYAAQATAEKIAQNCLSQNLLRVHVKLKGVGYGKEAALRGLHTSGLKITKIEDLTRVPFNGCRQKKRRRL